MKIVNPTAVMGEDAACRHLLKKGYKILERNFRKGYAEIDIIAVTNKTLVFFEVKTRTSDSFGTAFSAIDRRKLDLIVKTSLFYRYTLHPELPEDMRVDAIAVYVKEGKVKSVEQLENITQFL